MASSGDAAKIEFVGEIRDVKDKVGQMEVAFGRLTKEIQKTAKASADASRQKMPVKEAKDFASAINDGVKGLVAQALAVESVRRILLGVAEAAERGVKAQQSFVDLSAQTATKIGGTKQVAKIRDDTVAFSRRTGTTMPNALKMLEATYAADQSLTPAQVLERTYSATGSGSHADMLKIKDAEAESFAIATAGIRKLNPGMTGDEAASRAYQLNKAKVTGADVQGYLSQFKNQDTGIALAQTASEFGFGSGDISIALGKILSAQGGGADAKFLPAGSRGMAPEDVLVKLLSGGAGADKFFDETMSKGNKSAAFKQMASGGTLAKKLAARGGWLKQMIADEWSYERDPLIREQEDAEAIEADRQANIYERGLDQTSRRWNKRVGETGAYLEQTSTGSFLNTMGGAQIGSAMEVGAEALKEAARQSMPPPPPPPNSWDAMNAVRSVGLRSAPGMQIEVRVRNAGEQASRDSY